LVKATGTLLAMQSKYPLNANSSAMGTVIVEPKNRRANHEAATHVGMVCNWFKNFASYSVLFGSERAFQQNTMTIATISTLKGYR